MLIDNLARHATQRSVGLRKDRRELGSSRVFNICGHIEDTSGCLLYHFHQPHVAARRSHGSVIWLRSGFKLHMSFEIPAAERGIKDRLLYRSER